MNLPFNQEDSSEEASSELQPNTPEISSAAHKTMTFRSAFQLRFNGLIKKARSVYSNQKRVFESLKLQAPEDHDWSHKIV